MTHLLIDDEELLSFKDLEWSKENLPGLPVSEENEQKEENTKTQRKKPAAKNRRRVCLTYILLFIAIWLFGFLPTASSPTSTHLAIKCLKFIFLLPRKKDNLERKMKQNHTKHVYFSFFNPWKMADQLEIESLGWVHGVNSPWGKTSKNLCSHWACARDQILII